VFPSPHRNKWCVTILKQTKTASCTAFPWARHSGGAQERGTKVPSLYASHHSTKQPPIFVKFPPCLSAVPRIRTTVKLSLFLTKYQAMKMYPVLNQAPRHEDVWGSGATALSILKLDTGWRWVVSFTPRPLYPRGKSAQ